MGLEFLRHLDHHLRHGASPTERVQTTFLKGRTAVPETQTLVDATGATMRLKGRGTSQVLLGRR